jgi:rubrerythrin
MANEFNADDIFEIAVKIEENGAAFYRDAATKIEDVQHKTFLLDLAKMEDDHVITFTNMQKELGEAQTEATGFDPDDENLIYLKALADTRVFFKKEQPDDTFQSILKTAIQTEKDSIAFYLGMKELVPAKLGKERIDDIIKEEMSHIRIIAEKLSESL